MSLLASFDLSTRAMRAFQVAIQTISHNIANVNTPGYSRQRVIYSTENADYDGRFYVGRGVQVEDVDRIRNEFLEAQYRREFGAKGQSQALVESYKLAEDLLGEPGEQGLYAQVTRFRDAWSTLANNPGDPGLRSVLRVEGKALAEQFNHLDEGLTNLRLQADGEIRALVPQINRAAQEIFDLNSKIETATLLGQQPNDALDRREKLIADLSEIAPLRIIPREGGTVSVYLGGAPLVEASGANSIKVVQKEGDILGIGEIRWVEFDEALEVGNGKMKGLMEARDEVYPDMMNTLNTLASTVIDEVNALHRTGVGLDGSVQITGTQDFMGVLSDNASVSINGTSIALAAGDDLATIAAKITAEEGTTGVRATVTGHRLVLTPAPSSTATVGVTGDPDGVLLDLGIVNNFFKGAPGYFALSDAVEGSTDAIVTSLSGAPGDNAVARSIAALFDERIMEGGTRSMLEYHQGFLADVGGRGEAAQRTDESQQFVLDQVETMRDSVSGVSTEEEMANLIRYQRAFEMAARSVRAADEMLLTLINMIQR